MDYAFVAMLGLAVGAGEIVSRYRDAPWRSVWNPAAAAYLGVNALAAIVALSLCRTFDVRFGAEAANEIRTAQIMIAGFGAVAVLRSSLFVVRVGGLDIGVGPITLLQVLLFATDRDVDRRRAVQRARVVSDALSGLSYAQAHEALPRYCLSLMQNVSRDEEAELRQRVQETADAQMEDALKVNALGLALMSIVGHKVLAAAADAARTRILERGVLGEVYPRLCTILRSAVIPPESRILDVLGITLHTAWPNIKAWLDNEPSLLSGWNVRLRVIDPSFLAHVSRDWFEERWIEEARNVVADVDAYKRQNEDALSNVKTTIDISTYSLIPAVHGFRSGDGSYFLSIARWDIKTGKLRRPYESYEYLPAADSEDRAGLYKSLFDNWLDRADSTATNRVPEATQLPSRTAS